MGGTFVKRIILVLALLGSLLFAASASASGRDANGDRIPDRWEKKHGLSLKVKQTRRDQDKDGFKNRAEWRAQTDPRDGDSDDDGIEDGEENAGTVTAYDGTTLTITLYGGTKAALTGEITPDTEIECEADDATVASDDPEGDDNGGGRGDDDEDEGDVVNGGPRGGDDDDDDHGDEDDGDEHDGQHGDHDDDGEACAPDALKVGAVVEEAELKISSDGAIWDEIELR
jgi:hypothetical protein